MSSDELLNLPHSQIAMCHLKPSPLCLPPSLSLLTPCSLNPHLVERIHCLFIPKKKKKKKRQKKNICHNISKLKAYKKVCVKNYKLSPITFGTILWWCNKCRKIVTYLKSPTRLKRNNDILHIEQKTQKLIGVLDWW